MGKVAVERNTHRRKVTKVGSAERTGVMGLEDIHGVMETPEAKCVTAAIHAGLVEQVQADRTRQVTGLESGMGGAHHMRAVVTRRFCAMRVSIWIK